MKLAARLALLTSLFAGACHCPKEHEGMQPGRWQIEQTQGGNWLLTDTATGHAWLGVQTHTDSYKFVWHDLEAPVGTK
jgi:hypothetical protein